MTVCIIVEQDEKLLLKQIKYLVTFRDLTFLKTLHRYKKKNEKYIVIELSNYM
jgi:hypothetical protein